MSDQHTQGRLVAIHGSYLTIVGTNESIGRCGTHGPHMENARRLAACWNACFNLDTVTIEHYGLMIRQNIKWPDTVVAERDQLRTVLLDEQAKHKEARTDLDQLRAELAAARELLADVLAADDQEFAKCTELGLGPEFVDPIDRLLVERIRALLKGAPARVRA